MTHPQEIPEGIMSKPEGFTQDVIDAVVALERKYGDGHHSFELRDGIFGLIMAATLAEREANIADLEAQKLAFLSPEYASNQPLGSLCERFAIDECIDAIRNRGAK